MAYELDEVRISQEVFYYLLEHHELREEEEMQLYKAYTEQEGIQNLVKSQGEIAQSRIERYGNVIYLIPKEEKSASRALPKKRSYRQGLLSVPVRSADSSGGILRRAGEQQQGEGIYPGR